MLSRFAVETRKLAQSLLPAGIGALAIIGDGAIDVGEPLLGQLGSFGKELRRELAVARAKVTCGLLFPEIGQIAVRTELREETRQIGDARVGHGVAVVF